MCAVNYPYDDTATCNGDSGGPLIAAGLGDEPIEIGITSSGPVDCDTVSADFFTTVEPLSTWVSAEVKAVAPVPPAPAPAPTPTPSPPTAQPTLPQMTLGSARSYTKQTLTGVLGKTFKHRHQYQPSCARATSTRFGCDFRFWTGPNDYYGKVSVWFVFGSGDSVDWTDHYTIHWVNDHCYYHSGHRRRCKIHTKRGSF